MWPRSEANKATAGQSGKMSQGWWKTDKNILYPCASSGGPPGGVRLVEQLILSSKARKYDICSKTHDQTRGTINTSPV